MDHGGTPKDKEIVDNAHGRRMNRIKFFGIWRYKRITESRPEDQI